MYYVVEVALSGKVWRFLPFVSLAEGRLFLAVASSPFPEQRILKDMARGSSIAVCTAREHDR